MRRKIIDRNDDIDLASINVRMATIEGRLRQLEERVASARRKRQTRSERESIGGSLFT